MSFYIYKNDQQTGPYEESQIREGLQSGLVTQGDLVWREGMTEWVPIHLVPELNQKKSIVIPTPPIQSQKDPSLSSIESKSVSEDKKTFWTVFLLCVFLGSLGVHRFYLKNKLAWVQLITFGGCGLWTLIDLILILSGNMKDENGSKIVNTNPIVSWGFYPCLFLIFAVLGSTHSHTKKQYAGWYTGTINVSTNLNGDKERMDINVLLSNTALLYIFPEKNMKDTKTLELISEDKEEIILRGRPFQGQVGTINLIYYKPDDSLKITLEDGSEATLHRTDDKSSKSDNKEKHVVYNPVGTWVKNEGGLVTTMNIHSGGRYFSRDNMGNVGSGTWVADDDSITCYASDDPAKVNGMRGTFDESSLNIGGSNYKRQ